MHVIRLQVIKGPNVHDQIVSPAYNSFLVEAQMNVSYIHGGHADSNLEIRMAGSSSSGHLP